MRLATGRIAENLRVAVRRHNQPEIVMMDQALSPTVTVQGITDLAGLEVILFQ